MSQPSRPRAVRTLARQPPPTGLYASSYDPEVAVKICTRLAAGESLRAICRADPSMPTEKTVWNWRRAHPNFAHAMAVVLTVRRAEARRKWAARTRARAAARKARAATSADGRARIKHRSGYGPEVADAICARLCLGEPLYRLCEDPAMPSLGTVYNWLRRHPDFQAKYRRARDVAFAFLVETAADGAPWLGGEGKSMRALERIVKGAHRRCAKIAPRTFGDGVYGPED